MIVKKFTEYKISSLQHQDSATLLERRWDWNRDHSS